MPTLCKTDLTKDVEAEMQKSFLICIAQPLTFANIDNKSSLELEILDLMNFCLIIAASSRINNNDHRHLLYKTAPPCSSLMTITARI